jgi:hypothetical protein
MYVFIYTKRLMIGKYNDIEELGLQRYLFISEVFLMVTIEGCLEISINIR